MRSYLRFPFTADDQTRLDVVGISETAMTAQPVKGVAYPQSLRLDVIGDPARPPRALPLFSGQFGFTALDGARRGRIWVKPRSLASARYLANAMASLHIAPNRVFLETVEITDEFLYETLVDHLPRSSFRFDGQWVAKTSAAWNDIAPEAFLAGAYWPRALNHGSDPDQDDMVRHDWPVVPLQPNGSGHLTIGLALRRGRPDDIGKLDLLSLTWAEVHPGWGATDPANPAYGAVPAHLVYDALLDDLVDGGTGLPAADALRSQPPTYRRIEFSRTWKPVRAESAWLPGLAARVDTADGDVHEQRIPHHGVIWVPTTANQAVTVDILTLDTIGGEGWSWLSGSLPEVWREPGRTDVVDLAAGEGHVVVRRPFAAELMTERAWAPQGARCVYMTLRRYVRAFTENRITGGLLNHKWYEKRVSRKARLLHDQALASLPASHDGLYRNRPHPKLDPGTGLAILEDVLEVFHPQVRGGPVGGTRSFGTAVYELWLSQYEKFHHDAMDGWEVAWGGPAAAEVLGFGTMIHDPDRTGDQEAANGGIWLNRLSDEVATGLGVPAILQFWNLASDYERMRLAASPAHAFPTDEEIAAYGHSLYAIGYVEEGAHRFIRVVDQYGIRLLPVVSQPAAVISIPPIEQRIHWPAGERGKAQQVWIAADIGNQLR